MTGYTNNNEQINHISQSDNLLPLYTTNSLGNHYAIPATPVIDFLSLDECITLAHTSKTFREVIFKFFEICPHNYAHLKKNYIDTYLLKRDSVLMGRDPSQKEITSHVNFLTFYFARPYDRIIDVIKYSLKPNDLFYVVGKGIAKYPSQSDGQGGYIATERPITDSVLRVSLEKCELQFIATFSTAMYYANYQSQQTAATYPVFKVRYTGEETIPLKKFSSVLLPGFFKPINNVDLSSSLHLIESTPRIQG